jgi:ornithine cyclodeaminase
MENEAGRPVELTFLPQEDLIRSGALDMRACMESMVEAFRLLAQGEALMGEQSVHGAVIRWPREPIGPLMPAWGPDKRICAMPAYVGGIFNMSGVKWYGSNRMNPQERRVPRSVHLIVLNEPETGIPIAVMEGGLISAMRTGACAGAGAEYLASPGVEEACLVGAGVISQAAAMALNVGLPSLRTIKVFDPDPARRQGFAQRMDDELAAKIHPVETLEKAVRGSGAVVIAASGDALPVLSVDWLDEQAYVCPLGGLQDSEEVYLSSRVVVDSRLNLEEFIAMPDPMPVSQEMGCLLNSGALNFDDIEEFGSVVLQEQTPSSQQATRSVFLSFGLPIEDIAWATAVHRRAIELGLGRKIPLWEKPHWF